MCTIGVSLGTVKSRLFRGLQRLQEQSVPWNFRSPRIALGLSAASPRNHQQQKHGRKT